MITRQQALDLLHSKMESPNLRGHCYATEAVMRALAERLNPEIEEKTQRRELVERWGLVGLLHDGDYEFTKEKPAEHAKLMANWVRDLGETDKELLEGIESHGWSHQGKEPKTKMQWALFCCDELTGLVVAVTLVRPEKKLSAVTVENVMKKWKEKSFAAGVKREQIEECEPHLGIPLQEFVETALTSMQNIANDLGL